MSNTAEVLFTSYFFSPSYPLFCSNFDSFLLQLTMLITILISLGVLRSDANKLVILPLRRMLSIVLRCKSLIHEIDLNDEIFLTRYHFFKMPKIRLLLRPLDPQMKRVMEVTKRERGILM